VYAGQEVALSHCPDLFSQDTVRWDEGDPEFPSFMRDVLGLSKEIKKSCTRFAVSELREGVVKIVWRGDEATYVAFLNLGGKDGRVCLHESEASELQQGEVCLGRLDECGRLRLRLEDMPLVIRDISF